MRAKGRNGGLFSEEIGLPYEKVRKLPTLSNASMVPTRAMETLHSQLKQCIAHDHWAAHTIIVLSYGNQALMTL